MVTFDHMQNSPHDICHLHTVSCLMLDTSPAVMVYLDYVKQIGFYQAPMDII